MFARLRDLLAPLSGVGYRVDLFLQILGRLHHVVRRRSMVADQLYVGGIKVLHVVVLVGFSIGMVVSLQTGLELTRFGQQDQIGTLVALSMAREMGPFITAIILAAAVGSGVAAELGRSPLAGGASLGVHESQSRLWEILVGRSRSFWAHYYPLLRDRFPEQLADIDVDRFYAAANTVCPSLIRVEADEVTYNLHIILRFDLEKDLLEQRLTVADLPEAWNAGMESNLGVVPGNDADGVLQDIHWSMGAIGYFPTYTLGTLMSAQIFERARADIAGLEGQIGGGQFGELLYWLQDNIYRHGRKFTASELLERIGCDALSAGPWLEYVRSKYGVIRTLGS